MATLLIVDDQAVNVQFLHQSLAGLGELYFASTGEQALAMASSLRPELILLDIGLPGIDGYEVCRQLRADPDCGDTAVIFVTGREAVESELQALAFGGVDFLRKPLDARVVRARVETQLNLLARTRELADMGKVMGDVLASLPALVSDWDANLRLRYCNPPAQAWFSRTGEARLGTPLASLFAPHEASQLMGILQKARGNQPSIVEHSFHDAHGNVLDAGVTLVPRLAGGQPDGFLLVIYDITARKRAERALWAQKERLRITLGSIADAVISTDAEGLVTYMNSAAETLTGTTAGSAAGKPIESVMLLRDGLGRHELENPVRMALREGRPVGMALNSMLWREDGTKSEVEDSAAPIMDEAGDVQGAVIVFHDVSEAREMAHRMTQLAHFDQLTALPNRVLLRHHLEHAVEEAREEGSRVALVLVDVDEFTALNDTLGHALGDDVLKHVGKVMHQAIRRGDTLSRQGGDEFALLVRRVTSTDALGRNVMSMLERIAEPVRLGEHRLDLSACAGIAIFPDDADDEETLYRHADSALYRSKREGRGRFLFYSREIEERLHRRIAMTARMRQAVEEDAFEIHYQPKVLARENVVEGAEALLRWRGEDGALTLPAEFIPLAEDTGLIVPIGRQILTRACREAVTWQGGDIPVHVAVNVSVTQFADPDFVGSVERALTDSGLKPSLLGLEITESVLASDSPETLRTLHALKELGVCIALDDFGTGYSSLSYLKRFPLDILKIDKSFVRDMERFPADAAIVRATCQMAVEMGLRLIAEGVETRAQASRLMGYGCNIMQGYFYARPMPAADMATLLRQGLSNAPVAYPVPGE